MTQSRQSQFSLIDTPYYHCISRCVRRAFCVVKINLPGRILVTAINKAKRMHFLPGCLALVSAVIGLITTTLFYMLNILISNIDLDV